MTEYAPLAIEEGYIAEGIVLVKVETYDAVPEVWYFTCADESTGTALTAKGANPVWDSRTGQRAQKQLPNYDRGHDFTIKGIMFFPEMFGSILNATWDETAKTLSATAIGSPSTQKPVKITFYTEALDTDAISDGYMTTELPRCLCNVPNYLSFKNGEYTKYDMDVESRPKTGELPYTTGFVSALPVGEAIVGP